MTRNEWLGIRDWGLEISSDLWLVTKRLGDIRLPYRHFERKREIFVIRGSAVDVWNFQTGNLLPTHFRASPRFVILSGEKRHMWDNECQNSCDLSHRSRRSRHHYSSFLIPHSSFFIFHLSGAFIRNPWAPRPTNFPWTLQPDSSCWNLVRTLY